MLNDVEALHVLHVHLFDEFKSTHHRIPRMFLCGLLPAHGDTWLHTCNMCARVTDFDRRVSLQERLRFVYLAGQAVEPVLARKSIPGSPFAR